MWCLSLSRVGGGFILNLLRNGGRGTGSDRYGPLQRGEEGFKKRQIERYVTFERFLFILKWKIFLSIFLSLLQIELIKLF